jgi:hypothetical protein
MKNFNLRLIDFWFGWMTDDTYRHRPGAQKRAPEMEDGGDDVRDAHIPECVCVCVVVVFSSFSFIAQGKRRSSLNCSSLRRPPPILGWLMSC